MASTGCPSGEVQTRLRLGHEAEALKAAAEYQDIFGKENYFLELMDHGLDIETPGPRRPPRDQPGSSTSRRSSPTTPTTARSPTRRRTTCCCASRPARPWPTRTGSSSTAPATTSSRRRDVRGQQQRHLARGLPQLPAADRRPGRHDRHVRVRQPDAAVPDPGRVRVRGRAVRPRGLEGHGRSATRTASTTRAASRPSTRSGSSARWASPPTSWSSRTSSTGRRTTASRSAPAAAPRRARIVAYAMGITDLDPLVHGLIFERFLNPERISMPDIDIDFDERGRADVIRYVTQKWGARQGRPDHHLRDDQGQGRDQGLDPGPRLPLRARRPDHQGVPAGGHGQGHPAVAASSTRTTPATTRPATCATSTAPKPRSSRSSTPPGASRA